MCLSLTNPGRKCDGWTAAFNRGSLLCLGATHPTHPAHPTPIQPYAPPPSPPHPQSLHLNTVFVV